MMVTCVYFGMWYMFLGNQVGIKFDADLDPEMKTKASFLADRVVINTLEQMIPFLTLMWGHALFVNPETARLQGWVYVVTRYLYAPLYGMYGMFTVAIEVATQPNYVVIFYYWVALVYKCASGNDLHTKVNATSPWLMIPVAIGAGFLAIIFFLVLATPSKMVIANGVKSTYDEVDDEEDEEA